MGVGHRGINLVHAADHLVDCAEAEFGHVLPHLFSKEEEEIDDVLRLARETRAQHRVLRSDANRAGVQVTLTHHDAAHGYERRGRKTELLRAQQSRNHHVPARLQLAVGLDFDTSAQIIQQQHLLRLSQSKLPGQPCMLDRAKRRSAGTATISRDEHHICMSLGHARGDSSHAHLRNELDRNARLRIHVLQVIDQLCKIFNGVNVVVRRR